jgi:hypothetical protein
MLPPPDCTTGFAGAALAEHEGEKVRIVTWFSAVTAEEMQGARIITGAVMAALIGVGLVPGLRRSSTTIRLVLLVSYVLVCVVFVGGVLLRDR